MDSCLNLYECLTAAKTVHKCSLNIRPVSTYVNHAVLTQSQSSKEVMKMNALKKPVEQLNAAGMHVARRIPLTLRTLELLSVVALYIAGLVFVDRLTGTAMFPVVVYAMFVLPVVLSVGVRWSRTLERRLGLGDHTLPQIG